jgi:HAD superfamily, subfamily IIIB (Acid phosphatase)
VKSTFYVHHKGLGSSRSLTKNTEQAETQEKPMIIFQWRTINLYILEGVMKNTFLTILVVTLSGCALIPPVDIPIASKNKAQVVVFDIDGTLTPHDWYVWESRLDASGAVNAFMKKGYDIVYVTTRIPLVQFILPDWLRKNGFPAGTLHVAQTTEQRSKPKEYKAGILGQYSKSGWKIAYAYGDSTSDFEAYAEVGIPADRVFALKRRGESECRPGVYKACLDGWTQHLPFIDNQVAEAN